MRCSSSLLLQAWSQFAGQLEDLAQPEKVESALSCLNLLVTDALRHVPDVVAYLSRLRNQSVFNFCAIPQVWTETERSPFTTVSGFHLNASFGVLMVIGDQDYQCTTATFCSGVWTSVN